MFEKFIIEGFANNVLNDWNNDIWNVTSFKIEHWHWLLIVDFVAKNPTSIKYSRVQTPQCKTANKCFDTFLDQNPDLRPYHVNFVRRKIMTYINFINNQICEERDDADSKEMKHFEADYAYLFLKFIANHGQCFHRKHLEPNVHLWLDKPIIKKRKL